MRKAIICVDDEKSVLETLEQQLISIFGKKYTYEIAENGAEALQVIDELIEDEYNVVLVISDWLMPGMKGDEFLLEVHKQYPGVVKVLLTGQAPKEAVQNAFDNANLDLYIQKPWNVDQLKQELNTLV